ncbi:11629_t:CDS:2, partial [Funneliformis geosporum]
MDRKILKTPINSARLKQYHQQPWYYNFQHQGKIKTLDTLPTYEETFSRNFQLIHEDLQITVPTKVIYLGSPYDDTMTMEM